MCYIIAMMKILIKAIVVTALIVIGLVYLGPDESHQTPPSNADVIRYLENQDRQEAIQKAKDEGLTPVVIINQ